MNGPDTIQSRSALPPAVKICGLTRQEDVGLCLDLGVDFVGFIFAPGSPRRVTPYLAMSMLSGPAKRVGVFAGQPLDEVLSVMEEARLDYAQLHGDEDPRFCESVGPERVIKVLWPERVTVDGTPVPEALRRESDRFAPVCAYFLLDSGLRGGGSGKRMQTDALARFSPPRPWLLAGGLDPRNIASVLAGCSPFGVDCNSGVESAPGVKDAARLRGLMRALGRAAGQEAPSHATHNHKKVL